MNDAERPRRAARPDDRAVPRGGHAVKPGHTSDTHRAPHGVHHRNSAHVTRGRTHLRSSLLLTLASAVIPGSGLLGAPRRGHKALGALTSIVSVVTVAFIAYWAVTDLPRVARIAGNETFLTVATFALIIVAIFWVGLIALTQLTTRPAGLRGGKRLLGAVVVTGLAFCVAAPTAVAARYSHDTASAL